MSVQDDTRENELIKMFEMVKIPQAKEREGVDAFLLGLQGQIYPFELKSTTKGSVSTARDVSYTHLEKWRTRYWLIGIYSKDRKFIEARFGKPEQLEDEFSRIEQKIADNLEPWYQFQAKYAIAEEDRLALHRLVKRGATLNDPQIGKKTVLSLPVVRTKADILALI